MYRSFILLYIVFSYAIYAQIDVIRNINIDDGLAYSEITDAYKDSRGIIWLGTSSGLSEWTGSEFKNYYGIDGLNSGFIRSICEDDNHTLIVGTEKGVALKRKERFIPPPGAPPELMSPINKVYFSPQKGLFILSKNRGVWNKTGNKFSKIEVENKVNITPVSILERKNGDILIGTKENGIYQLKNNRLERIIYQKIYQKYPVTEIAELNKDTLYIALKGLGVIMKSKRGRYKFGNTFITKRNNLPSKFVNDILVTPDKRLYVATTDGVAVIRKDKIVKIINRSNGLTNEFINKIFYLKNNRFLFLSEGNGIYVYAENTFSTYNKSGGLLHDNVWAIKETQDGSMLFLTDEGISVLKENKFSGITNKKGLGDNIVVSVFEDKNRDLYFGTYSDGVNILSNGKITRINRASAMPNNSVWSILKSKSGEMLFATHSKGIAVFDGKRIIDTLGMKNGLPSNNIAGTFIRKNGALIVSCENHGLYEYGDGKFTPFLEKLKNSLIWSFYEDNKNNLYLGTNDLGLLRIRANGKIDTFNTSHGLSNNTVIGIEQDNFGNIYAVTDKGVNIIKFLDNGKFKIRQIFKQNGLADSECNQSAIYKDKTGNIWVGTIGGATRINPAMLNIEGSLTPVIISSFKVMDKEFIHTVKLKNHIFAYDSNDVVIKYAGLDYFNNDVVKYKYMLEGADKDWTINKNNEVRYANLPPGDYRFLVSASNCWGDWAEPAEILFGVKPPFWQTWWFYVLSFLLIILIGYSIADFRMKHLLRVERLRTKISADLHDEIGSGLSEISILSELLKLNGKNNNELENGLEHIGETTRTLIDRLSDIIWIVNPNKETIKSLVLRIQDNYHEALYHSGINFNIDFDEEAAKLLLPIEVKHNLYLISKEAINNALKYSGCTTIDFRIEKIENNLFLEVRDDGKGFDLGKVNKGNGLYNMKKRAEKINSSINIKSAPDYGTTIDIKINLKKLGGKKND